MEIFRARYDFSIIPKIIQEFEKMKKLTIGENCKCCENINHNSGHIPHEIRSFFIHEGEYFLLSYTTRKGSDKAGLWRKVNKETISKTLRMWIPEGFWYKLHVDNKNIYKFHTDLHENDREEVKGNPVLVYRIDKKKSNKLV
jgi:uncharacterized cysteine cluster protein YcgN (CxxCxxCC family)